MASRRDPQTARRLLEAGVHWYLQRGPPGPLPATARELDAALEQIREVDPGAANLIAMCLRENPFEAFLAALTRARSTP